MRATHRIEEILGSRSRILVLRALWRARDPLNAAQIALRTSLSEPAVATALRQLADAGIVRSSSAGRANVHQLVRTSVYVELMVNPILMAESDLPELLTDELRDEFSGYADAAVLFGSYSRGDQTSESDVDIVLVARDADSKQRLDGHVLDVEQAFRTRWGATLAALTYELREANALWRTSPTFLDSLKEDGIVLFGKSPGEWTEDE